ncbi:GGDEF domain-containing protein [Novosphingobium resinovorum]|uniref:GGDEF domain-containing protein n=1 Tax=Novosphingobium resinovorum TaxID=158500 RepID=UPI002ED3F710|nr:GGDEF domain-containing protein [Novosphingobium resinovorum]
MPDLSTPYITTIAACSTVLGAIMCMAVLLSWFKDGRPTQRRWQFAPFGLAVPAGILLTWPEILPGEWGLRLGWFGLTTVYGSAWLAARITAGREPLRLAMLLPCLAVLLFSCTLGADAHNPEWRMLPRVLVFALFDGLAAREFARMRAPHLQSATTLYWMFAAFCAFELARAPFSLWLPAPFGPAQPQVWSIALFNLLLVLEGVLLGVFLTALGREQLVARNYRLASIDPLTGIGNRRALDDRIAVLDRDRRTGLCRAVVLLDIDRFKTINDELGHAFGDLVIVGAASVARETLGAANVFRVGGEEFAAIVEAPDPEAIMTRAEALRMAFAARSHVSGQVSRRCTISIGVAVLAPGDYAAGRFEAADAALYAAKRRGRDQSVMADGTTPQRPSVDLRIVGDRRVARG